MYVGWRLHITSLTLRMGVEVLWNFGCGRHFLDVASHLPSLGWGCRARSSSRRSARTPQRILPSPVRSGAESSQVPWRTTLAFGPLVRAPARSANLIRSERRSKQATKRAEGDRKSTVHQLVPDATREGGSPNGKDPLVLGRLAGGPPGKSRAHHHSVNHTPCLFVVYSYIKPCAGGCILEWARL